MDQPPLDSGGFSLLHANADTARPTITISPRAAGTLLAGTTAAVALLCIAGTVCRVGLGIEHGPFNIIPLLDPYTEATLPAWYSSLLLLLCAPVLLANGRIRARRGQPFARHWLGLALLFALLSLDETASLHERLSWTMRHFVTARGMYFYAWVIPGSIGLMALALAYTRFVFVHLTGRTRAFVIMSGLVYAGAALGMEMVEGVYHTRHGDQTATYATMVLIEEIFEMVGIAFFLYALLDQARQQWNSGILITFGTADRPLPPPARVSSVGAADEPAEMRAA